MSGYLYRAIIAVICVVLLFALLPPLFALFGLALSGALAQVLKICIGGLALLYVIGGPPVGFFRT